jgi:translation initiation factor 4E
MLAAIGETLTTPYTSSPDSSTPLSTFSDEVTGVIVSSRKSFYRISVWTRTSDSLERVEEIGRQLKYGVLGMSEGAKKGAAGGKGIDTDVSFESHADSQKRGGDKTVWSVK